VRRTFRPKTKKITLIGESWIRKSFTVCIYKKDDMGGWHETDKILNETENNIKMNLTDLTQNMIRSWVGLPVYETLDSIKDARQSGILSAFQGP
jgi:hypothetical protein